MSTLLKTTDVRSRIDEQLKRKPRVCITRLWFDY